MTTAANVMAIAEEVATNAARAGGEVLLKYFSEGVYRTRYKEDTSLQTTADLESEQVIIETIQQHFPNHSIDSEERGHIPSSFPNTPYTWLVDSLDGTENFVLGIPYFSSSITLCKDGCPLVAVVYNPITEELYTAAKGKGAWLNGTRLHVSEKAHLKGCRVFFIPDFATKKKHDTTRLRNKLYMQSRRLLDTWSPALDWCMVASGKVDVVVSVSEYSTYPDGGTLILEEAGGRVTDFQNNSISEMNNGCIVGSNELLHQELLQLIEEGYYAHDHDYTNQQY